MHVATDDYADVTSIYWLRVLTCLYRTNKRIIKMHCFVM